MSRKAETNELSGVESFRKGHPRLFIGDGMIEWFLQYWIEILAISVIPAIFGSVAFSMWRDHRRMVKMEANPHRMNAGQYKNFNRKRFEK